MNSVVKFEKRKYYTKSFPQNVSEFVKEAYANAPVNPLSWNMSPNETVERTVEAFNRVPKDKPLPTLLEAIEQLNEMEYIDGIVLQKDESQTIALVRRPLFYKNLLSLRYAHISEFCAEDMSLPFLLIETNPASKFDEKVDEYYDKFCKTTPKEVKLYNTLASISGEAPSRFIQIKETICLLYYYLIYLKSWMQKNGEKTQGLTSKFQLKQFKRQRHFFISSLFWEQLFEEQTPTQSIKAIDSILSRLKMTSFYMRWSHKSYRQFEEYLSYKKELKQKELDNYKGKAELKAFDDPESLEVAVEKSVKRLQFLAVQGHIDIEDYGRLIEYTKELLITRTIPDIEKPIVFENISNSFVIYTYFLIHQELYYRDTEVRILILTFLCKVFEQIRKVNPYAPSNYMQSSLYRNFSRKPDKYFDKVRLDDKFNQP